MGRIVFVPATLWISFSVAYDGRNLAQASPAPDIQLGGNILAIASHYLGYPKRTVGDINPPRLEALTRNNEDDLTPPSVVCSAQNE